MTTPAPCPFCAGALTAADVIEIAEDEEGTRLWAVVCDRCCATGPTEPDVARARAGWAARGDWVGVGAIVN